MVELPVLVLNQNYEPLNICQVKRALMLLFGGKAEILENSRGSIFTANNIFDVPSVIRLMYYINRPHRRRKMTKLEVFNRDRFICQYCGRQTRELTIDHVVPKKRGGSHTWENVVSACVPCNRKKAGRNPVEAGMPLLNEPKAPNNSKFYIPVNYMKQYVEWHKYLPN